METTTSSSTTTIKRRVDIPGTLLAIPVGTSSRFRARTFAPYSSVRSAISRLNKGLVDPRYLVSTDDNGETYTVIRKA